MMYKYKIFFRRSCYTSTPFIRFVFIHPISPKYLCNWISALSLFKYFYSIFHSFVYFSVCWMFGLVYGFIHFLPLIVRYLTHNHYTSSYCHNNVFVPYSFSFCHTMLLTHLLLYLSLLLAYTQWYNHHWNQIHVFLNAYMECGWFNGDTSNFVVCCILCGSIGNQQIILTKTSHM